MLPPSYKTKINKAQLIKSLHSMILVASLLAGFGIHMSLYIVKAERGQILSLTVAKIVLKSLPIVN